MLINERGVHANSYSMEVGGGGVGQNDGDSTWICGYTLFRTNPPPEKVFIATYKRLELEGGKL